MTDTQAAPAAATRQFPGAPTPSPFPSPDPSPAQPVFKRPPRPYQIPQSQVRPAPAVRNIHYAAPDEGIELKQLLVPMAWAGHTTRISILDRIEVTPVDGRWFAELIVIGKGRGELHLRVLRYVPLETAPDVALPADSMYEARHAGFGKWRVIRKADRVVMTENLPSKVAALAWIASHQV